jgi:glycosyltransferase involved in cell wall biosynthesis
MHVVQLSYMHDPDLTDPDALLDRYTTLTGWSDALVGAGATRVTVALPFTRDALVERGQVSYHFVRPAPMWPRALAHGRLHRLVARLGPDLLHVNGLSFPVETRQLRRACPHTPIVLQDHADRPPRHPARRALRRAGLRAADAFVFAAAPLADPWRAAGLIDAGQPVFEVMESSTRFEPMPRVRARETTRLPGRPALLWVGRLNENKDPLTVLAGFERALPSMADARLTMLYHTDELREAVERRVMTSVHLRGRVELRGRVAHEQLPAYYSAADLFVLGSHREGSGYALLESMACGTVPVVTDIPSFRVITGGAVGGLWRPGDADSCASTLVRVASGDGESLRRLVLARFRTHLAWDVVGARGLVAYRSVTQRQGLSAAAPLAADVRPERPRTYR